MQGTRLPDDKIPLNPGEYALFHRQNGDEAWLCNPPNGAGPGSLEQHVVAVHEDGTISVTPSIQFNKNHPELPQWHGHLIKGSWLEC